MVVGSDGVDIEDVVRRRPRHLSPSSSSRMVTVPGGDAVSSVSAECRRRHGSRRVVLLRGGGRFRLRGGFVGTLRELLRRLFSLGGRRFVLPRRRRPAVGDEIADVVVGLLQQVAGGSHRLLLAGGPGMRGVLRGFLRRFLARGGCYRLPGRSSSWSAGAVSAVSSSAGFFDRFLARGGCFVFPGGRRLVGGRGPGGVLLGGLLGRFLARGRALSSSLAAVVLVGRYGLGGVLLGGLLRPFPRSVRRVLRLSWRSSSWSAGRGLGGVPLGGLLRRFSSLRFGGFVFPWRSLSWSAGRGLGGVLLGGLLRSFPRSGAGAIVFPGGRRLVGRSRARRRPPRRASSPAPRSGREFRLPWRPWPVRPE